MKNSYNEEYVVPVVEFNDEDVNFRDHAEDYARAWLKVQGVLYPLLGRMADVNEIIGMILEAQDRQDGLDEDFWKETPLPEMLS